jgi:FlaA1/EpsC-like NDP-sugar epimerase
VAALKHVILCEQSPFEAVQTNIIGCRNIVQAARANEIGKVIFTSSDKAVNPTNVMGSSKLMGERLMSAANVDNTKTIFASTRFGNVLGSRGSVIPLFREQIRKGGPITLTHPAMTRFIMSVSEAVRLVVDTASLVCGGEVFVTKMPVLNISDLADVMRVELAPHYGFKPEDIAVRIIGAKPGEKMYEELMTNEETGRAVELERYFAVKPAFLPNFKGISYQYPRMLPGEVTNPYISETEPRLSKTEIFDFLQRNNLLFCGDQ